MAIAELNVVAKNNKFYDRAKWKIISASSNERKTKLLFDANENTFWQTKLQQTPAELIIDFGEELEFSELRYLPPYQVNHGGTLRKYEISVSADNKNWSTPSLGRLKTKELIEKFNVAEIGHSFKADASGDMVVCGSRLYAAGKGGIEIFDIQNASYKSVGKLVCDGDIKRLLAGAECLFAVTQEGTIHCFKENGIAKFSPEILHALPRQPAIDLESNKLFGKVDDTSDYALLSGVESFEKLLSLVHSSDMHLVVLEENKEKVLDWRTRFDRAGYYGKRIVVHHATPHSFAAPAYIFNLVYTSKAEEVKELWQSVRPYGGILYLKGHSEYEEKLSQLKISTHGDSLILKKEGALPGSADWTHMYGDAANSVKSDDKLVKLPVGVLWFGGVSNLDVLPRHSHGPPQQVVGGRLYIEGIDLLTCRDVYTGRILWKKKFEKLGNFGVYYDKTYKETPLSTTYNQVHIPGANGRGTNYSVTEDRVYVIEEDKCQILDAISGKSLGQIPMRDSKGKKVNWGFIAVVGDYLIGGSGFANYHANAKIKMDVWKKNIDLSSSRGIVVFDRKSGKELWRQKANYDFLHNGIVASNKSLFLLDRLPTSFEWKLKRRGSELPDQYRIICCDLATGKIRWAHSKDIFGTWLGFSKEHNVLLQAGARARDRSKAELGQGMAVYNADSGNVIWQDLKRNYTGPCILHGNTIISNVGSYQISAGAYDLLTGEKRLINNPITGVKAPWNFTRSYGCNTVIASEHLLTFRSGAAGFYDLSSHCGTGNFGGFKSSCTSNLIIANGVLNAPDYTRTCSCAYQNQTSLALIYMPKLEYWMTSRPLITAAPGSRVQRLGINFGAPGDRISASGSFWSEWPITGGTSAKLPFSVNAEKNETIRYHASKIENTQTPWVYASAVSGVKSITFNLPKEEKEYQLKLYFADIATSPSEFSVWLNKASVLNKIKINPTINGAPKTQLKTVDVTAAGELTIQFKTIKGNPLISGVELIEKGVK